VVVDVFTHALTAALLADVLNLSQVLPFVVLGAVIADTDILFGWISDRSPSLYLFIHGGFSHSIAGTVVLSAIAWAAASVVMGHLHFGVLIPAAPLTFAAVLAGALLHICLDTLAVPGLPLLAPFSDRKYTAGLLPGPSIFLMAVSLFFVILAVLGAVDLSVMILPYAGVFAAFLAMRLTTFCIARTALHGNGRAIPTINPLRWQVIKETPEAWTVSDYRIGKGMGEEEYFMKYRSTSAGETSAFLMLPEVRRLQFHSSIVIAEKVGDAIIFSDPLRESGRIFYPPHYKRVSVSLPEPSASACSPGTSGC
jgi:inner membrane protein